MAGPPTATACLDLRLDAAPGDGAELGRPRDLAAALARRGHDRASQGMLAVRFDRGGQAEQARLVYAVGRDADDDMLAARQRAGLVEEHDVDVSHPLKRQAILDEDALARREGSRERDHQRDRRAQAWGGDETVTVRTTASSKRSATPRPGR